MNERVHVTSGGITFSSLLFLLFLTLKLTNIINWSWWWITAPLWGSIILVILLLVVMGLFVWLFMGRNKTVRKFKTFNKNKLK